MESKYYQPDISEFHVGFEYENFVSLFDDVEPKWEKMSWGGPSARELPPFLLKDFEDGKIRVKHLDHEDLESLGFKQGKLPYQYFSDLLRIIKLEKENLYSINANVDDHCLFYGTIKNKSELKRILKQIGYEQ